MGRNRIETLARAGFLAVLIGTAAYSPDSKSTSLEAIEQPASPTQLPTLVTKEIPKKSVPIEVSMLMRNYYLQEWRKSLPEDYEVSILDFGPSRHSGIVLPEEGLKLRELPTARSKPATYVQWLRWGQEVNFRLMITVFNKDKETQERWIVVDEKGQPGARWYCDKGWPRGHGRCFAAARIEDEELIDLSTVAPPPAKEITFNKWPRSGLTN